MNSSDSTNKDFSDSKQNASNFQNKHLSNGCVLSVLIDSHAQAGITYFVGTDGDGVNWGTSDSRASFPEQWEVVDTSDTPAMQSDHVRFMELKNYDKEDAMLLNEFKQIASASGEPFVSSYHPQALAQKLLDLGFRSVQHITSEEVQKRYFQNRTDGLYANSVEQLIIATV